MGLQSAKLIAFQLVSARALCRKKLLRGILNKMLMQAVGTTQTLNEIKEINNNGMRMQKENKHKKRVM